MAHNASYDGKAAHRDVPGAEHAPRLRVHRRRDRPRAWQRADLVVGTSFEQFGNGEVDAGFICGLPYVQLARQTPAPVELLAAPVIRGDRYAGRPIYFSDVIVHRDSPVRTFADLRGRSWAYNDPDSHSGYNLTRHHLLMMGETHGFFGRVVEAGFHQQGDADGCGG